MFYEWVSAGAIFGIEAFFALFVFVGFCLVFLGLVGMLTSLFHRGDDE